METYPKFKIALRTRCALLKFTVIPLNLINGPMAFIDFMNRVSNLV